MSAGMLCEWLLFAPGPLGGPRNSKPDSARRAAFVPLAGGWASNRSVRRGDRQVSFAVGHWLGEDGPDAGNGEATAETPLAILPMECELFHIGADFAATNWRSFREMTLITTERWRTP
jgi:hypothetical protein